MTQFHYEFRSRSLVGGLVLGCALLGMTMVALTQISGHIRIIVFAFLAIIAGFAVIGIVTDHRVGSSIDAKSFEWWSTRGLFPLHRTVQLAEIQSVEFVRGRAKRNRTFLRLMLVNGRTIKVATFFFRDGERLLDAFRTTCPAIATVRSK